MMRITTMTERLEATVAGRVQGVLYRDFACRYARALKLTGRVRNLSDGTVEVIAEGPREKLERFLVRLERGSVLARVKEVHALFMPATGAYDSFDIAY